MRFNEFHDEQTDEMIGVKKYQDLTAAQAMQKASEELGLPLYGRGAFGRVIQSPDPNWVYKFYERDSAYDAYVDFLQQHPNKHYPVIKKVKKMTNFFKRYGIQKDKFTVVVIEKLNKIPENKMPLVLAIVRMRSWNPFDRLEEFNIKEEDLPEIKSLWMAAAEIRHSHVLNGDRFMDLHSGNVMQRADGTIVLIDPVASRSDLDYGGDVAYARSSGEPMIKGPHYKTEPAQATPDDDPDDPHAPPPPASFFTQSFRSKKTDQRPSHWGAPQKPQAPTDPYEIPLSQQARMDWDKTNTDQWGEPGPTRRAKDRYNKLANKEKLNADEQAEKRRLAAILDQKQKIKK